MQLCILRNIMICEAIFRSRDLFFFGEPHISVNFTDTIFFVFLWQPGACFGTSSLPIFNGLTYNSGSGHPEAGSRFTIFFFIWQPGACSRTSSLPIFSDLTCNSGSGRPETGSRLTKLKKDFISVKYILIWGSPQKFRSLPLKMASHIIISLRMHNCIKYPPPLEINWQFQAPKVRGFFRHELLSFMKFFRYS